MGKRAAAGRGGIVVAQEIRALVEGNKDIKGPEVMAALRDKFPGMKFNENSCQVAYANARKKLGIARTVRKRPVGGRVGRRRGRMAAASTAAATPAAASTNAAGVDISLLQAAKALLQHCKGDVAVAQSALKQIASLQMS
jgi:hypothetical protein